MRNHVIISGTGRAGTTFLVQLLTALGQSTGYKDFSAVAPNCDGGMESDLRKPDAPYFVKDPWLCDSLGDILKNGDVVIDHALVPVRDLYSAAESRRDVSRRTGPDVYAAFGPVVPGGCWPTDRQEEQESVLARKFYALLEALAAHDIPLTLLQFPRLAVDSDYLFRKLSFCLPKVGYDAFVRAFRTTSRPDKIHSFPH
ncbi:MAG TPA: hypothetical protein VGJ05_05645 [Fimbriiglobus sp.]